MITNLDKIDAFNLMSRLGMTVENRRFHACAQIGHVHYGYARYKDFDGSGDIALFQAIHQCAHSYYTKHPEEKPNE